VNKARMQLLVIFSFILKNIFSHLHFHRKRN